MRGQTCCGWQRIGDVDVDQRWVRRFDGVPMTSGFPSPTDLFKGRSACLKSITNRHRIVSSPEMGYRGSAMSELIFIVFCSTSKMTAVDHPNIRAPFIAVMGPSSFQCSTGVTSP